VKSIWNKDIKKLEFDKLQGDIKTDVLIIGGGICGVLCAYMLKEAGIDCILAEADKICAGITNSTTAKITLQHGLIYDKIMNKYGTEMAALYYKSQKNALEKLKVLSSEMDDDFEICNSFVYSLKDRIAIEKEDQSWKTMWILFIIGIAESFFALAKEDYGLFFFAGIVTFILMFFRYWAFDENKFVKTQKGHELYRKVVGLKNYIKDYSNLSESELKEITIWEDYLIYAIILNDTSKLNKEAKDFYKKVCNIREDEIQKPKVKKSIKICAILSVITSLLSIVAFWNSILPIEVIIILILLNFFLIHKGKGYKEPLTIIGYILNIILTALVLLIIIGTLFDL